jgi:cytochrome c-type biogenesis protein CcmH/NrfF
MWWIPLVALVMIMLILQPTNNRGYVNKKKVIANRIAKAHQILEEKDGRTN